MTRNIYTVQAIPTEVCVCQLHFWLITSMRGSKVDLCHDIGMLEDIGQI